MKRKLIHIAALAAAFIYLSGCATNKNIDRPAPHHQYRNAGRAW